MSLDTPYKPTGTLRALNILGTMRLRLVAKGEN